ncbi:MAG: glycoside hydrolase, partial [Verrucomicrobia bacterium]|nr:glycoside hydrolase [Verrucomicrobiota bacterium]
MIRLLHLFAILALGCVGLSASAPPFSNGRWQFALDGEWRFDLDRSAEQREPAGPGPLALPPGDGIAQEWFKRDLPDRIQLPGVLQAQGFGNPISPTTPWVVGLGDAWWKLQPAALRERFSQPGRTEVPFLSQPPLHYLGAAWYQRDVEIPATWKDRRVVLFLERPHWETTVWLDERRIGSCNSLVAPHEYDFGTVVPGKHRLTVRVDNRQVVRDPQNDGHGVDSHSVSDALGATWNGIVGRIELSATAPVWIDDTQVFPDLAKKSVLIRLRLGNSTGQTGTGTITAGSASIPVTWDAAGGTAQLEVPLSADTATWDEFHPALHALTITLRRSTTDDTDTHTVTFGLREITTRHKDFLLNGRVVNLRTTHFGGNFPLTGYPAMDVAAWRKIIRTCQEFGLNGIRFHSWCPPEAAFIAADQLGFYLQPELGLCAPLSPGSTYTRFMEDETARLLRAYGNHPSFILLSPGNEPGGRYTEVTPPWAKAWHDRDPRRLYSAGTGWNRPQQVTGGAQYASLVRYGRGELRNVTGWFGRDYRTALEDVHIPVLAHENGQWCAYPDFDVIKKFTGYLRPSNYDIFHAIAEQTGVLDKNREFAWASGRFQLACYKEELEANLRTPGLAGHQMLDLRDYLGQGTALIGVLDAFWESKGYVTAAEFRRFHSATVPLARLTQRVFTSADTLACDVELYHFGEKPLPAATPYWKITDTSGRAVAEGRWPARDIPVGKNLPLGAVSVTLASLSAPAAYKLVVGLQDTTVENDWNFWLYPAPATTPHAPPANVLLTSRWSEAEARLAAGGRVLFPPTAADLDPTRSPPMKRVPV